MKNTIWVPVSSVLLLLFVLLSFGYAVDETGRKVSETGKKEESSEAKILALIDQLGAETFEAREKAYKSLAEYGDEARPYLKKALDNEDAEIRWRASRLIAELEGRIVVQLDEPPPASATDKTDLGLFRNQLKKLKELPGFGRQPLDDEFFKLNDNFFKGPFGDIFKEFLGKDAPFRSHMFDSFTWPDMGRLMKELNKNDGDISINIDGQKLSYRLERQEGQSSETCTLDVDENGKVVATVKTKDEKGDEVENRYEAENMKAFQENYPEIAEKFDVKNTGIIMSFPGARQHLFNLGKDGANRSLSWSIPQLKTGQRRTLGVYLDPEGPGKVLRAHLGLTDNEGVIIEKVLPGSFASKIDLRPMDIVTAINGQIVGSAENIRDILETVEASDNVEVKIFRNGEKKVLNGTYDFENTKKDAG